MPNATRYVKTVKTSDATFPFPLVIWKNLHTWELKGWGELYGSHNETDATQDGELFPPWGEKYVARVTFGPMIGPSQLL